ncbi:MAG: Trk system potassium transporter TrkA [Chiayiivirga sp.]|jgi:trk system potassium uptake protein TrkA|uniref:Trk system potassium transporter TrkA n=1 Tax=Chiayiivirga sp. TaxID=2041042 RepID=UPI0025BA5B7D|nr:Trk system potassium transporter TrkA [Chiayiivirga sp.]MCI1711120.1 Trk system potassium transporter TrkA [Chiayiivirga sp.]MCI1728084.1 Trk system potassium transporter TrkA [Chiayiivirga sp.]
MKILILGAGQVGASVAAALASENSDITVVDLDQTKLRELSERLDIRTIVGHASLPSVLGHAGAEDADLIIAVTSSDEVNLIACQVADALYKTPTKIARLREIEYLKHPELTQRGHSSIDVAISPEALVCKHVQRLIEYPGALQVLDFADGRAQLVAVRALAGGALVGHQIKELREHLPRDVDARVAAIFRAGKPISPQGHTVIEVDDEVFFLADRRDIRTVMSELRRLDKPVKRVFIAGGGNIGRSLAKALEAQFSVKILERSRDRAKGIAEDLRNSIVLVGDCADEDLLREENIDQTDVYCALTNDDEANILSSMLAKRMGCQRVISLINRPAYAELVEGGSIDIAVSPQQVTLGALLTYIRQGTMVRVHSLRRGMAEAIEAVAIGDRRTSRVIGRALEELELPSAATIGGIVRGEKLLIAHHDVVIEANDHVIVFLMDKRQLPQVEALFRADATWI